MPVINPNNSGNSGRSTFRPPWVKDGPGPLPMPAAPWIARSREQASSAPPKPSEIKMQKPILKKQTKVAEPSAQIKSNGQLTPTNKLLHNQQTQEKVRPIAIETKPKNDGDSLRNYNTVPSKPPVNQTTRPLENNQQQNQQPIWRRERDKQPPPPSKSNQPKTQQQSTMDKNSAKPPPPPMPPMPPPPPMTGGGAQPEPIVKKPLTKEKAQKLEALRSRPRRRPDWSDMMKEVESGRKLKHVQCNDRSAPVIPNMKNKGQFVYESEEKKPDDGHHKLLKQIQTGVRLKKTKCNDRSKPNLDGLRKFRRQMTIEEQIQKSVSMADIVAAAVEPDELDDIDKVRDDLQSAKQMLALELRNKEAIERENKRLAAKLANLEAELEKEKCIRKSEATKGPVGRTDDDEKLIMKLKEDATEADRVAKDMEVKYHTTAEELDNMRRKLESAWLRNQQLEMQLSAAAQGAPIPPQIMKQASCKRLVPSIANGGSIDLISDDEDEDESESESEEESEADENTTQEKQICKEMRLLTNKLRTNREKQCALMKERRMLKEQLGKRQNELKEEKKKYKILQKEVDKMAKLMRETEDDDEEEATEEEEEETESESESEESEEEKSDGELPPGASIEDRRRNLGERTKRHENRLSSLKKGNYLMKANIERLQDDINKQREMSIALQEDLDNILADLG